jgi:ppGpp synthetase/RelA/SpoT-type nucleotidyltranferase
MNGDDQLPAAIEALFKAVQVHATASEKDEDFFRNIRDQLDAFCAAVACALGAGSSAAFFVTPDLTQEADQRLCMRGAWGRLRETLNQPKNQEAPGREYPPFRDDRGLPPSLTQIAWHCGLARWANTRADMEKLRAGSRSGQGDKHAYPGRTLDRVFRNGIIVPIFAPGRVCRPRGKKELDGMLERIGGGCSLDPGEMAQHLRFLQSHRVVGLLKVENKKPRLSPKGMAKSFRDWLAASCPCGRSGGCIGKQSVEGFLKEGTTRDHEQALCDLWEQMTADVLEATGHVELAIGPQWDDTCGQLVDYLVKIFDATFSNQDVELLVAVAMLLGRVLPWRTIQRASARGVVLDEHEVGSLLIRPEDIEDLKSLRRAADQVAAHVRFLLEGLQSDAGYDEKRRVIEAHKQGILPARSPIAAISARTKTIPSLLRKGIRHHDEMWDREASQDGDLFTQHRLVVRALDPDFYNIRDVCGVRVTCDYLSDVVQVVQAIVCRSFRWNVRILKIDDKLKEPDASGYRSVHLDLLVRANDLIAASDSDCLESLWQDEAVKQFKARRQARKGGEWPHAGQEPADGVIQGGQLWLPCEVQIRTAYEDSWATKSHDLVYKLDRSLVRLPNALEDFLTIMSNNLFETDRLSDIVQEQIQEFLAPELGNELHLKALLRERLPKYPAKADGSFPLGKGPFPIEHWPAGYLAFTLDCAKELYRQNIRYGGMPRYVHALSVVLQMIRRFQVFPVPEGRPDAPRLRRHVTLFAVAMLHDCWGSASNDRGIVTGAEAAFWKREALEAVELLLELRCRAAVERYQGAIDWKQLFSGEKWVAPLLNSYRDFWRAELGLARRQPDSDSHWDELMEGLLEADLLDVCRLRAALLIERMEELPEAPNADRRRERFRAGYAEFRQIRDRLQGTNGAGLILPECYTTIQSVATRLGVEIPIHWYE